MDVEYEPLEPILTPEAALAPDAIQIDPEGNVIGDLHHQAGDVEAGLAEADIVLENTFTTEPVDHCFLEPPAGLAFVDPDGVLTVLVCTQYPHYHHRQVARVTGLGMDRVRVVQTVVGGAFGGKMDNTVECAISLLALETGRPVRMIYTRDEVFTTTTKRHAMTIRQRLGATRDGRLTALDAEYLADGGAYRSYSLIVGGRCVIHTGMPYRIPNVRAHYTVTFTNHPPSGAMRSFGVVKVAFAIESQLNELADRLGMSPIELRRINGMVDGERTPIDQTLWDIGFHQTLDAIEPIYERRKRAIAAQAGDGRKRGLGIACLGYGIGYSGVRNPSTARMRVDADGVVTAFCGRPTSAPAPTWRWRRSRPRRRASTCGGSAWSAETRPRPTIPGPPRHRARPTSRAMRPASAAGTSRISSRAPSRASWVSRASRSVWRAIGSWRGTSASASRMPAGRSRPRSAGSAATGSSTSRLPRCQGQVFAIWRQTVEVKSAKRRSETAYGVTSLTPHDASPQRLLTLNRGHWTIEATHHILRLVLRRGPHCRIRTGHGPENMTRATPLRHRPHRRRAGSPSPRPCVAWPGIRDGFSTPGSISTPACDMESPR